jgi:adenosylcobinamide kinase / adenosylcobinamide-phosphate guanylyltransferase
MLHLVLGGDKSGKSAFALRWLERAPTPCCCVVTGLALDFGFRGQLRRHRLERPPRVPVFESGPDLGDCLRQALERGFRGLLLDSLDFWVFSRLTQGRQEQVDAFSTGLDALARSLDAYQAELCVVSCEIGLGPIAADSATRAFARRLGGLHQELASRSASTCLVLAGQPIYVKDGPLGSSPTAAGPS